MHHHTRETLFIDGQCNLPHALRMAKRLLQESRVGPLDSTLSMAAAMQRSHRYEWRRW